MGHTLCPAAQGWGFPGTWTSTAGGESPGQTEPVKPSLQEPSLQTHTAGGERGKEEEEEEKKRQSPSRPLFRRRQGVMVGAEELRAWVSPDRHLSPHTAGFIRCLRDKARESRQSQAGLRHGLHGL